MKLLDQGVSHHGRLYLATEYVPSISLAEHLAQRSVSARVRICSGLMAHILSALQYAHARSLVTATSNLAQSWLPHVNRRLSARLADFGVAKSFLDAGLSQITRAGDVVGSLPFIAPEQFVNSREARPSCDLYSVGANALSVVIRFVRPRFFRREEVRFSSSWKTLPYQYRSVYRASLHPCRPFSNGHSPAIPQIDFSPRKKCDEHSCLLRNRS